MGDFPATCQNDRGTCVKLPSGASVFLFRGEAENLIESDTCTQAPVPLGQILVSLPNRLIAEALLAL
jgi:hypothetical protein